MYETTILFPAGKFKGISSLRHCVQNGSGAHQATYPMDTGAHLPRRQSGRLTWSWRLASI